MTTITTGKTCVLCEKELETNTPVLIVNQKFALHVHCWHVECSRLTAKQLDEYIRKKIAERRLCQ